ncbi:hypothetical protein [Clostridium massiliodielmoense]|uniref:hypothetical protein n=1 Tax=Clostridium massiliodielmoense TaxID=1776385 RepID=UPI0004D36A5C|nr:hypothetical protein [Clostridium massiliodielmoense]KEH98718.1 hypothetical protein Z962_11155 [Clostridium botulinum C/D str. BKT12695]
MNRGKIKKIFAMAVISGTLMVGAKNTAYAVITDYAIKLDNQVYSYNKSQLEESFLNYKAGEDAKLYEDFHSKLGSSKGFYAFKDDKRGFVSYEAIEKGFLKSKDDKKSFDVEKFVENDKSESLEVKETKEVVVNDKGSLEVKENKQDTVKDSKIESNDQKGSSDSSSSSKGSSSSKRNKGEKKTRVVPVADKVVENRQPAEKEEAVEVDNKVRQPMPAIIPEGEKPKEVEVPKAEAQVSEGSIRIKSETTQTAQKFRLATNQVTTILIEGTVENNGSMEISGKSIPVNKGDKYHNVADKIYNAFKENEDWSVEYKYVQSGYKSNLTFTSKKHRNHIDFNLQNSNGIVFKTINEEYGQKAIGSRMEICTVTVLDNCTDNTTLKIKVLSDILNKTFAVTSVDVQKGDTKEKIAEKITTQLKSEANVTQYFNVKNEGVVITLTQKEADPINLKVTMENVNKKVVEPAVVPVEKVPVPRPEVNDDAERQAALKKQQQLEEERQAQKNREAEEAAERAKIEKEREAEVQNQEIQIESKCIEKGSTVEFGRVQTGNLAFKLQGKATDGLREDQEAKLTKDQTAKILDKTIEFKAGDDSSKIKSKILKVFEGHKDWVFEVGFVVIENHGASVKYTCNKIQDDVYGEKFAKDTEEIKFMQSNVTSGEVGKPEVKEKLEIAVKKLSNRKSTVNISIKIKGQQKESGNVNVEIEAKDSVDQVAQKIAIALKGNDEISRLYKIEVQKDKVILTQNMASKNETEITIK